jgi:hypothetical protein
METFNQFLSHFLSKTQNEIIFYVILFVVGSLILFFLAKSGNDVKSSLNALELIKLMLHSKLGNKADGILDIWIEGLKKIQDGEFSEDDAVDQFVRYIRLGCAQRGIQLTDEDVDKIHLLVMSTLEKFTSKKPKTIEIAVNKFNAMNFK